MQGSQLIYVCHHTQSWESPKATIVGMHMTTTETVQMIPSRLQTADVLTFYETLFMTFICLHSSWPPVLVLCTSLMHRSPIGVNQVPEMTMHTYMCSLNNRFTASARLRWLEHTRRTFIVIPFKACTALDRKNPTSLKLFTDLPLNRECFKIHPVELPVDPELCCWCSHRHHRPVQSFELRIGGWCAAVGGVEQCSVQSVAGVKIRSQH